METTFFRYGKHIGALTALCLAGVVGVRLYQADQIEQRAKSVGWDLNVPIFGLEAFDQMVADSERLKTEAEELEWKYGVAFPHPYSERWLSAALDSFRAMSRSGMVPSKHDLSTVNMDTWLALRPLLNLRNIPPGTYTMGCTREQGDACYDWENPSHTVTISQEFYIMDSEVTQALYELVMGNNPSRLQGPRQPVEHVSWYDAVTFANRLSELDGLDPCYTIEGKMVQWPDIKCSGWRLPTEAEWEYAARGRQNYKYAGSDSSQNVSWYYANSNSRPHEVCTKPRNGYGLCDMSGNLWEWVWDWYGEYSSEHQTDPTGPETVSKRVLRGGSWRHSQQNSRVTIRYYIAPEYKDFTWGFRLVRLA